MKRLHIPHWHWHCPPSLMAAWRWWLSEMHTMLPSGRFALPRFLPERQVLVVPPAGLSGPPTTTGGEMKVSLRLPDAMILRRRLTLPQASMGTLRKIVAHEIERLSPLRPEAMHYDLRIMDRDRAQHKVTLEIRMAHREPLDQALAWCREHNLHPDHMELEDSRFRPTTVTLPKQRLMRLDVLLTASIALLTVSLVVGALWRGQSELDGLTTKMTELRNQAHQIGRLQDELKHRQDMAVFLPKRRSDPLSSAVLEELARLLPDDSWLFQMELNGRTARLRGYSATASSLIALLDASPLLSNAQFRAPLTPGLQPGQERFDISVEIREAAP